MKRILSVLLAVCTVLAALCIPPAPAVAQSTEPLASAQIEEAITLPVEEEPITLETLTEDCKILQYVDEEAFAAADHAFRLPYLEELDTYVFQNTDGTRSIYYLYENVKYIDEQGNIREKDNTLQRETKGFRITENEFDLLLPHAITDGVELTYQGYDVKLIPATGGSLTTTQLGALRDNSVVYESFFGAGTSLVYTPLLSGVKEEIILEEYFPNKSFSFLLYTDGLFLNNTDGSYILAESKTSTEAVLYLGDIVVYDAVGRPSLGNLTVETVKDGNIYALTVSADEAFLSDPATVYPVTIDPDLTISDANNGSGAIEDTTLFSGTPNLNTGNWVYNTAGYVDETYGAGRILVRLPGLYNDEVYQGLTADRILSATFYTTKSSSKTPDYVNLYRCTDYTWGETTATWNNAANLYATDGNLGTSSASSSVVAFNITSLAKAWRNYYLAPSAGFMLINQNETNVNKKFGIYASEYSVTEKRPYVVLNYSGTIWLDESEISIAQGNTRTLIATTDPAGGTVTWTSSNEAVATVTAGVVTANAPGFTTITATYVDGNRHPHTAECVVLVWLPSDTYTINNGSQSKLLQLPVNAYTEGSAVYGTNGVYSEQNRWTYFKINHLGNGVYSIRSMLDNSMGLKRSGNSVVCGSIGTSNNTVPAEAKWAFGTDSGGTYIYSYNGSHTDAPQYTLICAPVEAMSSDLWLENYCAGEVLQYWAITPVAADCEGVTIWEKVDELLVGRSYTFEAAVYSTNCHEHGGNPITWSLKSGTQYASLSSTGTLTATSAGTVTVKATYDRGVGDPYEAEHTVYILPFADGTYLIKNRQNSMYADVELASNESITSGSVVCQWERNAGSMQEWFVSYHGAGYHTISKTVGSTVYYWGVANNSQNTDTTIVLRTGPVDDGALWRFIPTNGAYRVVPKLAEAQTGERALVATTSDAENGHRLAYGYYVGNNNSYRDEWYVVLPTRMVESRLIALDEGSEYADGEEYTNKDFFEAVGQYISTYGDVAVDDDYQSSFSKTQMKNYMYNSDVFVLQTHGQKDGIQLDTIQSFLLMEDIAQLDLSEMKLAVLLTCYNGQDFNAANVTNNDPQNFMEQMLCCGAETVIAFNDPIYVWDSNPFVVELFRCMLEEEMTVQDAIRRIGESDDFTALADLLAVCEVGGNGNLNLYDYYWED
ncbi:MAG: Ig-like domain-containing protein [Clostridia bacterium]|nr:Ig-like domain-containing protein [Clostridia bacterium]